MLWDAAGGEILRGPRRNRTLAALMTESVSYNKSIADTYYTQNLLAIYDLIAILRR